MGVGDPAWQVDGHRAKARTAMRMRLGIAHVVIDRVAMY